MDPRLTSHLAVAKGATSATALVAGGVSRRDIDRALGRGDLVRIRRNALVDGPLWQEAPPWDRHVLRARAVAAGLTTQDGCPVVLTHHSALAIHGIGVHGVDDRVHLSWADGRRGATSATVSVHRLVASPFVMQHDGIPVVTAAAACVQVAAQFGGEAGLVSANHALHRGSMSQESLDRALVALGVVRCSRGPREMAALADPRIESAAESRALWVLHIMGIPRPTPQVSIRDEWGTPFARVDFLIEDAGVIIEIDGMAKYEDIRDLRAEKVREDRLRSLGYEVVRLTWADLADPLEVRRTILAAMQRAARRSA